MKATFNLHNLIQAKKDKLLSEDFDLSPTEETFAQLLENVSGIYRDHAGMTEEFKMMEIFHALRFREPTLHFQKLSERLDELIQLLL